ncbi:MAG: hypothetical protein FWC11_05420, partial [Firmicutes bacterium]|nr:hypothetical protein [Bacillota bacterium]
MKMRKKLLALVMVLAMMAVAIFAITACRDPEEPYVTGITATYTQQANITPATALSQLAGGLRVVANYSDETYREIPFNPVDGFSLSGNLNQAQSVITVTYGEHTTTFTVNVTIAATIYGIEVEFNRPEGLIVTPATNLESILEHLDVEVILTDGTRRPLAQGETIVLTGNFNVALNTITANLGTHSDTFTVESRVATGIAVQFNQQLTENFITPQTPLNDIREHATVTVTYSDGHTRTLPNAEFTLYGNLNVASSELIARHISHGVLHVSAPFNVTVRVVEGIAVDFTQPATLITPTTPLAYLAGTLLVTASYNIGPTSTPNFDATGANGFTLTGDLSVLNANDEATVTVNYRGLSATFLVEVDASVYMTGILSATVAPDQARVHIGMNPNDISIKNQITVVAQYSVGTRELLSDEFILSVANDSFVLGSNLVTVTTVIGNFTATVFIYVQQMEFSDLNQIPVPAGRTRIFLYNGFTQWNTVFIDVPAAYSSGGAVTTGAPRYQALMNQMGTTDWWWFDLTVPATLTNPTWGFWINFGDPAEALLNPQGFRIHGSSNFAVGDYPYAGLNFFVFYRSENAWSSATSQYYTGYVRIRNTAVADAARGFNSATALLTEANRYFNQPEVESGTFDQLNPGDVELSANLKGRAIDSLTLGNETLVEDVDFIYYDGTLTILEAFFATRDIGSFEFTITTVGNFTSTFTILVFYDGADPFNMLPAIPTGQVRLFFYNGFINIINPHMYMWIGGGVPSMTPRWTVETTRVDGTNWFFIDTRGDWPAGDIL